MTTLPPIADFTAATVTEDAFKTALSDLRGFLSGLLGEDGLPATALATLGAQPAGWLEKTGAYSLATSDRGRVIAASGTWTLSLPPAATAGAGFAFWAKNAGAGTITIDPDGAETIDGATTLALAAARTTFVVSSGTAWLSLRDAVQVTPDDATAGRLLTTGASATVLSASPALRVTTGGTADAITLTTGAALGAIPTGLSLRFRANTANTGATTINVDGTGDVACKTIRNAVLPAGYIRTDADTEIMYDGATWIAERQIERGSNANGWYVRHADGTQICQLKPIIKPASDATAGVKSYAWTYPAEFATGSSADISTVHTLQNSSPDQRFAVVVGTITPTDCILYYNEPVGIASDIRTMATATGRWY